MTIATVPHAYLMGASFTRERRILTRILLGISFPLGPTLAGVEIDRLEAGLKPWVKPDTGFDSEAGLDAEGEG